MISEARKKRLLTIALELMYWERLIRTFTDAVFDMFDAAICTREEARELTNMDAKAFSLGLRARRRAREISRVWP